MIQKYYLAIFGIIVTVIFLVRGVKGGVFYGMVITAIAGMIFSLVELTRCNCFMHHQVLHQHSAHYLVHLVILVSIHYQCYL